MALTLFPKTIRFFDFLQQQNAILQECTQEFLLIMKNKKNLEQAYKYITIKEAEAEQLARKTASELSQTFITPIDREDIYAINLVQKDVINLIKSIASRLRIYSFPEVRFPAKQLVESMAAMATLTGEMLALLTKKKHNETLFHTFATLKTECGMLVDTGLAELHDISHLGAVDSATLLNIMTWVQVYDRIELTFNRLDDLADTLEEVTLKNA